MASSQAVELAGLCGAVDWIAASAAGAHFGASSALADHPRPARHKPIIVWARFNFFTPWSPPGSDDGFSREVEDEAIFAGPDVEKVTASVTL
jgi:hypothetical protein